MNKKLFSKTYNKLDGAKKKNASTTKIQALSSVVIVISVLIWAFFIHVSSIDKVKVVNQSGEVLEHKNVRQEDLKESLITSHCERTILFCNSFDRFTLKSNQASTYFLMNKKPADEVFSSFQNQGVYKDALQRGWQYKSNFERMVSITGDQAPYKVQFISKITATKDDETFIYEVKSQGVIDLYTPQYPENPFGLIFTKYKQQIKKINNG